MSPDATDCKNCAFRESGCLRGQTDEAVDYFSKSLTRLRISGKSRTIVHQDEETARLVFVCGGMVKMSRVTEDGEEVILSLLGPCSLVGGINSQTRNNASYWSAETMTDVTEIAYLNSEDLSRAFHAYPELGFGFSRYMSRRLRSAYRMIGNMRLPVEQRLLAVLARIMELLYGKCENRLVEFPFSYRVLAQFAQVTPETLSRTLHALQKKGIVDVEKRGIRILQAEALRKYSDLPN